MRSKIDPTLNYIGMYTFFGFSPVIYDAKKIEIFAVSSKKK